MLNVSPKLIQNLAVIMVLVVFVFTLRHGFTVGRDISRSRIVVRDVNALLKAMNLFFWDQSRYPSIEEFSNKDIMSLYLNNFPPKYPLTVFCSTPIKYDSVNLKHFSISFCIPRSYQLFIQGNNQVTDSTPFSEPQ